MGATVPQWVTNARWSVLAENNSQRRWSVFFTTATASMLQVSNLCWLISLFSHEWDNEVLYTRPQEEACSSASQDFVKYSIVFSYGESFFTCMDISICLCVREWESKKEIEEECRCVCVYRWGSTGKPDCTDNRLSENEERYPEEVWHYTKY